MSKDEMRDLAVKYVDCGVVAKKRCSECGCWIYVDKDQPKDQPVIGYHCCVLGKQRHTWAE